MRLLQSGITRVLLNSLLLLEPALASPSPDSILARESSKSAATCNGRQEYCERSYSNITFVGSHDAPFVGKLPQQNQNIGITAQLDMGIRFLQAQTHHSILDDKVLELCHTSCWLEDAGKLESFLSTVRDWLDSNPDEVVTLLLTNGDSLNVSKFGDAFSGSGIADYAYVPSSNPLSINDWPTLGDLISSGKRLVVFLGESKAEIGSSLTKLISCRLRCRYLIGQVHSGRVQILLRDALRCHRCFIP